MTLIRYEHWFEDCTEHEECTVHVGEGENEEGAFRTESHLDSSVDPAFRLNLDYPDADDRRAGAKKADRVRWRLADDDAIRSDVFPWNHDDRRRIAAVAAAKGLGSIVELATIAGADPLELVDEAHAGKWIAAEHVAELRAQIKGKRNA